jgi:4-amino-4-deoxy-L-arabinose transferase-like glycosyltransferase
MGKVLSKIEETHPVYLAVGIFLFALSVRLVFLSNLERLDPQSLRAGIDFGDGYHTMASRVLETHYGRGYMPPKPAGYPLFLAAAYATLGKDPHRVRLVQCFMGSLSCVVMFLLGVQLFKRRLPAILAGLLCAGYFPFVRFDVRLNTESLFMLLFLSGLMAFFRVLENASWRATGICGCLTGLGCLVRAEILYVLPFVCLYLIVRNWFDGRRGIRAVLLVGLYVTGITLVLLPVMVRNAWAVGSFSLSHPQGFWILWAANSELGYEQYVNENWDDFYDLVGGHEAFREKYEKGGLPNSWFIKETLSYVRDHPGRYAWLKTVQLLRWFRFFPREIITPLAIVTNLLPAIGFLTLILCGVRRLFQARILLFWVAFYTLFYLAVSPEHRHRLPILDPVFVLYAGYGVALCLERAYHLVGPSSLSEGRA